MNVPKGKFCNFGPWKTIHQNLTSNWWPMTWYHKEKCNKQINMLTKVFSVKTGIKYYIWRTWMMVLKFFYFSNLLYIMLFAKIRSSLPLRGFWVIHIKVNSLVPFRKQSSHHIETSLMISNASQLTNFYMMAKLIKNNLI